MNRWFCIIVVSCWAAAGVASAADNVDYIQQIKPLLVAKCYACHGALKQEGGLRLETKGLMLQGGDSGSALVAGNAENSLLLARITAQGDERMPPLEEGVGLRPAEIALLHAWIQQGADAPAETTPADPGQHWSFQKPVRLPVPAVNKSDWSQNPIDAFLAAGHEKRGLLPVVLAARHVLLRRVYLDLVGLPPTPQQLQAFLADAAPDAYGKVVRDLLDRPQHGERWGRHWMDIWRYSDWYGLGAEVRTSHLHIWRWRDWIIQSLNENKPYNQMIVEMLAGDEIAPNDPATLRATGFLARNWFVFNRDKQLDDTIAHTSQAFLGLTIQCARCHDHKYDPIRQVDYYRMRAFFEPYQPRLDPVPGESDINKNGLARVFDLYPEKPTYLFLRGNDKDPDQSRVIQPGVPDVLAFSDLEITPVALEPEVYHPDLQAFVLAEHVREAESKVQVANAALEKAQEALQTARQAAGTTAPPVPSSAPAAGKLFLSDDFTQANGELWETGPGDWSFRDGNVVQTQAGVTRSFFRTRLEHPVDFTARLKVRVTAGGWRSVGLSFDVVNGHEKLIYLSAYAPDPKLQLMYNMGQGEVFPPGADQRRAVDLNTSYELTVNVRGPLVNVAVNGEHALAYAYPVQREVGRLDVITFDATAEFESLEVRELPPHVKLVPVRPEQTVATAESALRVAQQGAAAATLRPVALRTAHAADVAKFKALPQAEVAQLVRDAALSARKYELALAAEAVARAQQKQNTAETKDRAAAAQEVAAAEGNLKQARQALQQPGEKYASLRVSVRAANGYGEKVAGDDTRRGPFPKVSTGRRTALAHWIASPDNPLTARVAVNHIWLRHFGQPLVESVADFGQRAERPVQHVLLDWLAVELMENNWNMKHLHQLMVTSRAYQLSSSAVAAEPSTRNADPQNESFWRRTPQRMESQVVRDSLLYLAGVLDETIGGPAIAPDKEGEVFRRSLYFTHSRDKRGAFVSMFDDADVMLCYRRVESIVPQQALALANSKLALSMARRIASRLQEKLGSSADEVFIKAAFETVLQVQPTQEEVAACREMLEKSAAVLASKQHPHPAVRARGNLVQVLVNHNNFVTIR